MYEKINVTNNIKLILTKDDFGFKDVIDSFNDSSAITIITYSIKENLLSTLYNLDKNKEIIIVTNIPGRFDYYKNDPQRKSAKHNINITEHILNASKFNPLTTTYLNFANHSKIIISDTMAYIGSQNFYGDTSWEGGTLIKSKSIINELKNKFVNKILDNSLPYNYNHDLSHLDNILEIVKNLELDLEEHLSIANLQSYECGIDAESIILNKESLLYIINKFLDVANLIYKFYTPITVKNQFNVCLYNFYESFKYNLNVSRLLHEETNIHSTSYYKLFCEVLYQIKTCNNHLYELNSIDNIENLIYNLSQLNCYVENYIIDFYRFKNSSIQQIDNTED